MNSDKVTTSFEPTLELLYSCQQELSEEEIDKLTKNGIAGVNQARENYKEAKNADFYISEFEEPNQQEKLFKARRILIALLLSKNFPSNRIDDIQKKVHDPWMQLLVSKHPAVKPQTKHAAHAAIILLQDQEISPRPFFTGSAAAIDALTDGIKSTGDVENLLSLDPRPQYLLSLVKYRRQHLTNEQRRKISLQFGDSPPIEALQLLAKDLPEGDDSQKLLTTLASDFRPNTNGIRDLLEKILDELDDHNKLRSPELIEKTISQFPDNTCGINPQPNEDHFRDSAFLAQALDHAQGIGYDFSNKMKSLILSRANIPKAVTNRLALEPTSNNVLENLSQLAKKQDDMLTLFDVSINSGRDKKDRDKDISHIIEFIKIAPRSKNTELMSHIAKAKSIEPPLRNVIEEKSDIGTFECLKSIIKIEKDTEISNRLFEKAFSILINESHPLTPSKNLLRLQKDLLELTQIKVAEFQRADPTTLVHFDRYVNNFLETAEAIRKPAAEHPDELKNHVNLLGQSLLTMLPNTPHSSKFPLIRSVKNETMTRIIEAAHFLTRQNDPHSGFVLPAIKRAIENKLSHLESSGKVGEKGELNTYAEVIFNTLEKCQKVSNWHPDFLREITGIFLEAPSFNLELLKERDFKWSKYLRFGYRDVSDRNPQIGVTTKLTVGYATEGTYAVGVTFVEASVAPGKGDPRLTGKITRDTENSASVAVSVLFNRLKRHWGAKIWFEKNRLQLNFSPGSDLSDGPSGGIAIATAIASLITGKKVDPTVAMTGELSSTGAVLAIGGVKQKVTGAYRDGVRTIIIPEANKADLEDVPSGFRDRITFVIVRHLSEVFKEVFGEPLITTEEN